MFVPQNFSTKIQKQNLIQQIFFFDIAMSLCVLKMFNFYFIFICNELCKALNKQQKVIKPERRIFLKDFSFYLFFLVFLLRRKFFKGFSY